MRCHHPSSTRRTPIGLPPTSNCPKEPISNHRSQINIEKPRTSTRLGNERGPLFMPIGHLEAALPDESAGQEQQNEVGFILGLLWRRKYLVAAFCAVGLLVASVVAMFIADRYTSQVVIQARFVRQAPQLQSMMILGADSLIQTEINFIHSRDIAEDVVIRLGLANDPNTVEHPSSPSSSATSRIAAGLLKRLEVTNDPKS